MSISTAMGLDLCVLSVCAWLAVVAVMSEVCRADAAATGPVVEGSSSSAGRLCRVRLVTDAEPDVTSIESILRSVLRERMTDEQKCLALFWFAHDHRYWYPRFYPVRNDRAVYDPVLIVNCYPAIICQQDAAVTSALWAAAGFDVRYWQLGGHTTGEVFYNGQWRNFDATNGRYVRDADGGVAGVQRSQRRYKADQSRVEPFDDFVIAHEMHLSLRTGETFTRYWQPLGDSPDYWLPSHHPDARADDRGGHRLGLRAVMARKPYRFDTRGAGIANGLWDFQPDVRRAGWQHLFERVDGIVADADGLLRPADDRTPGELVLRAASPYTITGAWLTCDAVVGQAGEVRAAVSADHGRSWRDLAPLRGDAQRVALREAVAGGFEYLLRLRLTGPTDGSTALGNLRLTTAVQLNPLSLPALKPGRTILTVAAAEQVETMTLDPNLETPDYERWFVEHRNVVRANEVCDEAWARGLRTREPGKDSVLVLKATAPGDIRRVRWGGRFRTADGDVTEMFYSTDGATWQPQPWSGRWTTPDSPVPNHFTPVRETTEDLPAGTRTVFLKYRFVRPGEERTLLTSLRADVDYVPPGRTGTLPLEVTYCWQEDPDPAADKTHIEVVPHLPFTYTINIPGVERPLMKWVRLRLATGEDTPDASPSPPDTPATTDDSAP